MMCRCVTYTELRELEPLKVCTYLEGAGWMKRASYNTFLVYSYNGSEEIVAIPVSNKYSDYGRRICEVLDTVVGIEGRCIKAIYDDIQSERESDE